MPKLSDSFLRRQNNYYSADFTGQRLGERYRFLRAPQPQTLFWSPMNFENRPTLSLRPYPGNARTHSPKQIKQISRSIERFGFNNPVLVDDDDQIIAGHGRVEAAKLLGLKTVPTVRLSHLSEDDKRAYILADNPPCGKGGLRQ
jgi:hypothetical protein